MGPEIFVVLIVFMTPVLLFFTHRYFRLREKQLEAQASGRLLLASSDEQNRRLAELQARVENLESILIDTDGYSSPRAQLPAREARGQLGGGASAGPGPDRPRLAEPSPSAGPRGQLPPKPADPES